MTDQRFSDETLMAFADGELSEEDQRSVEQALEKDEALAARVAIFLDSRTRRSERAETAARRSRFPRSSPTGSRPCSTKTTT